MRNRNGITCLFGAIAALGYLACGSRAHAEAAAITPSRDPAGIEFFETRVRPVLAERCYECHSQKTRKSKGGLELDSIERLLKGGDTGAILAPGDPDASLIIRAIRYTDPDIQMPPKGKLPDSAINDLEAWIRMGAPLPQVASASGPSQPGPPNPGAVDFEAGRKWWAFQPIGNPAPPPVGDIAAAPTVIDQFIQARLESEGLAPARPANKRELIRRATFDLTGLPPTPEEVAAFLADESPDAFARVVDRLLASPAYGERWGRRWLDVARYTDSVDSRASFEQDVTEAWRYRDWVVRSLNADLPYDQFIRMQIAGDVIGAQNAEGFDRDGLIATGLLVLGNWPGGDADKEKMVSDIVDDQIDIVTRGIMGVTVACARCHDHKFDPFTTRDYYALAGMFYSTTILPGPGRKTEGSPILHLPLASPGEMEARRKLNEEIAALSARIETMDREYGEAAARALLPKTSEYIVAAWDASRREQASESGSRGEWAKAAGLDPILLDRWIDELGLGDARLLRRVSPGVSGNPNLIAFNGPADNPSFVINKGPETARFVTITQPGRTVTVHPAPTTPVAVEWKAPRSGKFAIAGGVADADATCGEGVNWSVRVMDKSGERDLAQGTMPNGGAADFPRDLTIEIAAGDRIALVVAPGQSYSCDTTVTRLTIKGLDPEQRDDGGDWDLTRDAIAGYEAGSRPPFPDAAGAPNVWSVVDPAASGAGQTEDSATLAGRFRLAIGAAALESPASSSDDDLVRAAADRLAREIANAVASDSEAKTPAGAIARKLISAGGALNAPVRSESLPPMRRAVRAEIDSRLKKLREIPQPPYDLAIGVKEGGVPDTGYVGFHDARIHIRGSYAQLGDVVPRRMPEILSKGEQPPITEGSGRRELAEWVASPENPLTARVIANRVWQGHFGEGLVRTPGNFGRLGEAPTHPELLDHLARALIDSGWSLKKLHRAIMLTAAYQRSSEADGRAMETDPDNRLIGRMNRRRLEAEAIRDAALAVTGELDATMGGPAFTDLTTPRRTLYLKTVRSDRATFGALFDAADPAALTDKRTEATVSGQALFMMNNPFMLARAEALAKRAREQNPEATPEKLCAWLYERLFSRPPTEEESKIAESVMGGVDDEKALEKYTHILLCSNEFLYID